MIGLRTYCTTNLSTGWTLVHEPTAFGGQQGNYDLMYNLAALGPKWLSKIQRRQQALQRIFKTTAKKWIREIYFCKLRKIEEIFCKVCTLKVAKNIVMVLCICHWDSDDDDNLAESWR